MDKHHILLVIHLICATIWVGGHLVLLLGFLPKALKFKNFDFISRFENTYEPIGMPSLVLLIITGILMAYDLNAPFSDWFSFKNGIETVVSLKFMGIITTICFAISAQTRVLPKLAKGNLKKLPEMAVHILFVTLIGVTLLILGSTIRNGGFLL
ncbi:MAG: copper resistance protein CopD [Capnocytophaga sp.]|nr:copper resistance protein CopD [Capnocytophaga sp.]